VLLSVVLPCILPQQQIHQPIKKRRMITSRTLVQVIKKHRGCGHGEAVPRPQNVSYLKAYCSAAVDPHYSRRCGDDEILDETAAKPSSGCNLVRHLPLLLFYYFHRNKKANPYFKTETTEGFTNEA